MDILCDIYTITIIDARSRCSILPYVHWRSRNSNLLCTYYDSVYMDCKRCVVLLRISIQLHRCANMDSISTIDGFGILGNKEKQTLFDPNRWSTLWHVNVVVQHDQSN